MISCLSAKRIHKCILYLHIVKRENDDEMNCDITRANHLIHIITYMVKQVP